MSTVSITFRFGGHIRPAVMALGELLYYANSREDGRWASQHGVWEHASTPESNGVYGHVYNTVHAILREELGEELASAAMDCINYGGNRSFGEDIESAVQEALEMRPRCEWCGELLDPAKDRPSSHAACDILNSDYGPDGR